MSPCSYSIEIPDISIGVSMGKIFHLEIPLSRLVFNFLRENALCRNIKFFICHICIAVFIEFLI